MYLNKYIIMNINGYWWGKLYNILDGHVNEFPLALIIDNAKTQEMVQAHLE